MSSSRCSVRSRPVISIIAVLVLASVLVGCARPAEERAERDLLVGHADSHGLTVNVDGGLAVVRIPGPGTLQVWASAPSPVLRLQLADSAPRQWTVEARNLVRNTWLTGEVATVELLDELVPTQRTFRVTLDETGKADLQFVPMVHQTDSVAGGEQTVPLADGEFSFAVLSDVQEAIDEVQDLFSRIEREPIDFLLGAGDLTRYGSESELRRFQTELRDLDVPYYSTLGNHELGSGEPAFHELFGRGNFHFRHRGVHFTLVDSASATVDPLVYDWIDGWLKHAGAEPHVVAMHIPPIDPIGVRNGSFASRNEAAKLLTRLAAGGVDLTIYGHIHSHYAFENAGIPARISGGGGAIPERFDQTGRHYLVVDVAPSGLKNIRVVQIEGDFD